MSTNAGINVYPCDRGDPTGPRYWHHYEAGPTGIVVCRYCGQKPTKGFSTVRPTRTAPYAGDQP